MIRARSRRWPIYFSTGRFDEAAPIYDQLAEEAKSGRPMSDYLCDRTR